jgi:hypothetical protein
MKWIAQSISVSTRPKISALLVPIDATIPTVIEKKINPISRELPCKDLNLTREKAPTTASDVPKFPFTVIITIQTRIGSIIKVLAKFLDILPVFTYVKEIINPKSPAYSEYKIICTCDNDVASAFEKVFTIDSIISSPPLVRNF